MIKISTAFINALQASTPNFKNELAEQDIFLGDGDGTGGRDTINSTTTDLSVFEKHSFVKVVTSSGDSNRNLMVKILDSSTNKLEVAADLFTSFTAGPKVYLVEFDITGSIATIMQNSVIRLFSETVPTSADNAEPGTPICEITLNGAAFTPGSPLNGLNFGDLDGGVMRRAIDPETGASEVHEGDPSVSAQANSFYWYANDRITGQSIASKRIIGSVTGKNGGGDMDITNGNSLTAGTPVRVEEVRIEINAIALN